MKPAITRSPGQPLSFPHGKYQYNEVMSRHNDGVASPMSTNLTSQEIIASALQLSWTEREQIVAALQESLIDESIDHGPEEPTGEVEAAWSDEIARRIADIDSGRVKTIPSEQAWKIINGEAPPAF
jgi:putative addiction module component (TIGR02574 family)